MFSFQYYMIFILTYDRRNSERKTEFACKLSSDIVRNILILI